MNLAQAMYKEFSPKGAASIQKNIDIALDDIREAMMRGETSCRFDKTWTDLPDDWVIMPETIEYLKQNGFEVEEGTEGQMFVVEYAIVTWPNVK